MNRVTVMKSLTFVVLVIFCSGCIGDSIDIVSIDNTTNRTIQVRIDNILYDELILPNTHITLSEKVFVSGAIHIAFIEHSSGSILYETDLMDEKLRDSRKSNGEYVFRLSPDMIIKQ